MTNRIDDFEATIAREIHSADMAHASEARDLDAAMEEHVRLESEFERMAADIHREELRPRVEAVVRHLEGARLDHVQTGVGTFSTCALPRSERFPASTTLSMGVAFDVRARTAAITYRLDIRPMLMEFEGRDELRILAGNPDREALGAWVERKLQGFVQTYLSLEHDARYRTGVRHTDPVCGMSVGGDGMGKQRHSTYEQRTFYFCSAVCLRQFEASPRLYAEPRGVPLHASSRST